MVSRAAAARSLSWSSFSTMSSLDDHESHWTYQASWRINASCKCCSHCPRLN
jgi:hypothetical protein